MIKALIPWYRLGVPVTYAERGWQQPGAEKPETVARNGRGMQEPRVVDRTASSQGMLQGMQPSRGFPWLRIRS